MHIVLIPTQGFCNRLRALASAYILSKYLNSKFYLIWKPEECCNIKYDDIFNNKFETIDINELNKYNYFFNPNIHTNVILSDKNVYNNDYLVIQGGHEFKHENMSMFDFLEKKRNFYKSLKFTNSINNIVNGYLINPGTIGIHFRDYIKKYDEADGRIFNEESPIELFIIKMKNIMNKHPHYSFFVSTNSNEILDKLNNLFPNKITSMKNVSSERNDYTSMINAIANVVLLSKCQFIIGTYMSSFSDEACFFNMIPKLCISIKSNENNYHCYGYNEIFGEKMLLPSFNILRICN
jgi:hypothetical protein